MPGVLVKGGNLDTETDGSEGRQCEARGRMPSISQGMCEATRNQERGMDSLTQLSEGTNPANTLISDLQPLGL